MKHTSILKAEAMRLGFSLLGITSLEPPLHAQSYLDWIEQGKHASMAYLASSRGLQARLDPRQVFPPAQSVVFVAAAYPTTHESDHTRSTEQGHGKVAAYASGPDYHQILPQKLLELAELIRSKIEPQVTYYAYTDTGPVLERDLAQRAGLGWVGKNTCLINLQIGSYFLLAELFLSTPLEPSRPFDADYCGNCRKCIDACPTQCISENHSLDARRCISFLTIENRAQIPAELRPLLGDWLFGCDICQQVCPWNQKASRKPQPATIISSQNDLQTLDLLSILSLSPQEFNHRFRHTPIHRAKRRGLLRNAAVVAANTQFEAAIPTLSHLLLSDSEPLVRAHAAWALGQFATSASRQTLQSALKSEIDGDVLVEIQNAAGIR